jgi:DNA-binding IclR family transcriptional regulator
MSPRTSLRRALRLLELVDHYGDGATLEELAQESALPPETVRGLLHDLTEEGYLHRLPDGGYVLGSALALLGQANREHVVRARLLTRMTSLRDELGAAVYFARYAAGEVLVDAVVDGPEAPCVEEWVDFRASGHASAVGKCLLGQLDHDGRREHLSRYPPSRLTARTLTDPEALLHRLDRQPPSSPVLDVLEYAPDTVCAAVPLTAGATLGCLALSLPGDQAYRLREAAEVLSARAAPLLLALAL